MSVSPPDAFSHIAFRGSNAVIAYAVDVGIIWSAELKFTTDYGANWVSQSVGGFYFWPPLIINRKTDVDFLGNNVMLVANSLSDRIRYFSNPAFGVGGWTQAYISAAIGTAINPYIRFTSNSGQDVLVTWEDTTANQIFENHTSDFGATWAGLAVGTAISAIGATAHQFEALTDGTGIVVWQTQAPAPTPNTIEESHTSNGGAAFSAPVVVSGTDVATIPQLAMKANFGCALWIEAAGAGVHAAETIDSGATWGIPTDPALGSTGPFQTQQIAIGSYLAGFIGNTQTQVLTSYGINPSFLEVFATGIANNRLFLQYDSSSLLTSNYISDAVSFQIYSDAGLTNLIGETFGTILNFRVGGLRPGKTYTYYVTWTDAVNVVSPAVAITIPQ